MLVTCPECGTRISHEADFCPNCGLPEAGYSSRERCEFRIRYGSSFSDIVSLHSCPLAHSSGGFNERYIQHGEIIPETIKVEKRENRYFIVYKIKCKGCGMKVEGLADGRR